MSYIQEDFNRTNLQMIREFIRSGSILMKVDSDSQQQRIKKAYEYMQKTINNNCPTYNENQALMDSIELYIIEVEDVYTEIGMKYGASLAVQLLGDMK